MKSYRYLWPVVVLIGSLGLGSSFQRKSGASASPARDPSRDFLSHINRCLDQSEKNVERLAAAVNEAAKRMAAGNEIYSTDDETGGGFASEAAYRAGGLRHLKLLPLDGNVGRGDVVLVGTLGLNLPAQAEQLRRLQREGDPLIILFGSRRSELASLANYVVDNGLGPGISPVIKAGNGDMTGPVAGIANVTNMWVFTAELVAALTRMGRMPSMYQSILVPGAREWNARVGEFKFHPDLNIPPVKAGVLGRNYLRLLRDSFSAIELMELKKFGEAGKLCAEAIRSGHRLAAGTLSHFMPSQARLKGFPPIFSWIDDNARSGQSLKGRIESGDVWLMIGYSYYPLQELTYLRQAGAKSVALFVPGPAAFGEGAPVEPDPSLIDIYIDPHWRHGDAVVEIPGYGPKIIPVSGVIMASCYWMVLVEIMDRL